MMVYFNKNFLSIVFFVLIFVVSPLVSSKEYAADQRIPFALTISGGVSLGAYESGSNWAFLRYLKQNKQRFLSHSEPVFYDLVAVTGASAGSINALISAIAWCADENKMRLNNIYQDTANNNLFYQTWSNVGLDNLLPDTRGFTQPYSKRDGLFSRKPFNEIIEKITALMNKPVFIPQCEIPFGLTVTAEKSSNIKISGLTVQNQRQFIPLSLKVDSNGKATFYTKLVNRFNPNFGHTIYLSSNNPVDISATEYPLTVDQVVNAVLASSAFPVAFGRMVLNFCVFDAEFSDDNENESMHCPDMHRSESGVFVDGGVFDNIPLGATMALAEGQRQKVKRRVNYIYIDPDHRRYTNQSQENRQRAIESNKLQYNLASQLGFLSGSVNTARKYELFKVLRSRDWDSQLSSKRDYLAGVIGTLKLPSSVKKEINALMDNITVAVMAYENELQFNALSLSNIQDRKKSIIALMIKLTEFISDKSTGKFAEFELAQFVETFSYVESDLYSDRRLFLSSRFPLITGEYLGAFAAFFSKDFRDYDYYVGVYDAIIGIASTKCALGTVCDFDRELDDVVSAVLGNSTDKDVHFVFSLLLEREKQARKKSADKLLENYQVKSYTTLNSNLKAVACSLLGQGGVCEADASIPEGFTDFVNNLKTYQYNYQDNNDQDYLAYAMENQQNWWRMPAYHSSARLSDLENSTDKNGKRSVLAKPLTILKKFSYALYKQEKMTAWWRGIEFGTGVGELGSGADTALNRLYLAWNLYPKIVGIKIPFVSIRVLPYQRFSPDENSAVGSVGLVFWPVTKQRFGIGPDLSFRWAGDKEKVYSRVALGANIQVNVYSIKISAGVRSIKNDDLVPNEHRRYMNIGWMF